MRRYANGTTVSVAKSRAEIEMLLGGYGATAFASGWDRDMSMAVIMCEARGRRLHFKVPMPVRKGYLTGAGGKARTETQIAEAMEAESRRRWRALALVIKAKLEAVHSGIETFEAAFLANVVVPGGGTVGDWAVAELARAYESGIALPPLLGSGRA